jgi:hypothetical protein
VLRADLSASGYLIFALVRTGLKRAAITKKIAILLDRPPRLGYSWKVRAKRHSLLSGPRKSKLNSSGTLSLAADGKK